MAGKAIHILCTRPVDPALVNDAVAKGIEADVMEFIQTVAINDAAVKAQVKAIAGKNSIVIFTSMNAVDAVVEMLDGSKPSWKIFCMGNTTRQLVIKYFGEAALAGTAADATALANNMVASPDAATSRECVFFCGDQRRDELPGILHAAHFTLNEITVYKTIETSHAVNKTYDAVLFFSPSAVHSFFKTNQAAGITTFFAIGNTTANAISRYCSNKIIVGDTPAKDALFKLAIAFVSGSNVGAH